MHVTCDQIDVRTPFNVYHKAHVNTINFHVHVTWNQIEPIYSFKVDQLIINQQKAPALTVS